MNSQMTDLAFAGKCGACGASGLGEAWGSSARANRSARASMPRPPPARARNSRRDRYAGDGGAKKRGTWFMSNTRNGSVSPDVQELVQAEEHLAEVGQG